MTPVRRGYSRRNATRVVGVSSGREVISPERRHEMNTLTLHIPGRERNVLVVALDTVLPAYMAGTNALVVVPASNSWLRRWLSDEDDARRKAEERATVVADLLELNGVRAKGRAGDADPLLAIADALSSFAADEIVIAVDPARSSGAAEELGSLVRDRFALPTTLPGRSLLPRAA